MSGCRTTIMYNYADWLIAWKVDDFVELSEEQEKKLQVELETFFNWHRTIELPKYLTIIDAITSAIAKNDTEALLGIVDEIIASGDRLKGMASKKIIALLNQLTTEQKQQLLINIKDYQLEKHSERLDKAKSLNEKLDDSDRFDVIEDVIGDLTPIQKQRRDRLTKELHDTLIMRIESQKKWLSLFSAGIQPTRLDVNVRLLEQLFTEFSSYRSAALIAAQLENRHLYQNWSLDLLKTMSKKQKETLLEVLNDYRQDVTKLLKKGN